MNKHIQNSVLSIKLDQDNGIRLDWSFKGSLQNDVYFRHLLIAQVTNSQFFHKFSQMYIARIKNGDLFCVKTPYDMSDKPKFIQKTSLKSYQNIKRRYDRCKNQTLEEILNCIGQYSPSYSQPIIITIVYDYKPNLQKIKNMINQYRKLGLFDFIFNICGHVKNNINFGNGIHTLSTQQNNLERSLDFIKWYINNLSMIKAEVEITCQDGQINVQSTENWAQTDFYNIKKKYYGLTNHQLKQEIFFFETNVVGSNYYDLKVKIAYEMLNKKRYYDYKIFTIDCQKYKTNIRTCINQPEHYYEIVKNFYVESNPFETRIYLFFAKQPKAKEQNAQIK